MYRHETCVVPYAASVSEDQEHKFRTMHSKVIDLHNATVARVRQMPDLSLCTSNSLRADPYIKGSQKALQDSHKVPSRVMRYVTDSVAMTVFRGDTLKKRSVWWAKLKQRSYITFPADKGFSVRKDNKTIHLAGLGEIKLTESLYNIPVSRVSLVREDRGWLVRIRYVDTPENYMLQQIKKNTARNSLSVAETTTNPKDLISAVSNCPDKDRGAALLFDLFKTLCKIRHDKSLPPEDVGKNIGQMKHLMAFLEELVSSDTLDLIADHASMTPTLGSKNTEAKQPLTYDVWCEVVAKVGDLVVNWEQTCKWKVNQLDLHENVEDIDYLNLGFVLKNKEIIFGTLDMSKHKKPKPKPKPRIDSLDEPESPTQANDSGTGLTVELLAKLTATLPADLLASVLSALVKAPVPVVPPIAASPAPAKRIFPLSNRSATTPGALPAKPQAETAPHNTYGTKSKCGAATKEQAAKEASEYVRKHWPWAFMTRQERIDYVDQTRAAGKIDLTHQYIVNLHPNAGPDWFHPRFQEFRRDPENHEWFSEIGGFAGLKAITDKDRQEVWNMTRFLETVYRVVLKEVEGMNTDWLYLPPGYTRKA